MSLAVDGQLAIHPWLRSALSQPASDQAQHSILGEDVFSLIVAHSKASGLASFSGDEPPSVRWGHNDAGGDWTQDATVRRLARFQCAVPEVPLTGRRLPVQPALTVLDKVLTLAGVLDLTAVHAVVPLAAAPDGRFDLVAMAKLSDFPNPETARAVWLTLSVPASDGARFDALPALVRARSMGRIGPEQVDEFRSPAIKPPHGTSWLLNPGERTPLTLRCTMPTWSIDAASWLVELLIETFRELGELDPVAVSATVGSD